MFVDVDKTMRLNRGEFRLADGRRIIRGDVVGGVSSHGLLTGGYETLEESAFVASGKRWPSSAGDRTCGMVRKAAEDLFQSGIPYK